MIRFLLVPLPLKQSAHDFCADFTSALRDIENSQIHARPTEIISVIPLPQLTNMSFHYFGVIARMKGI